jgi:hypothetical protein
MAPYIAMIIFLIQIGKGYRLIPSTFIVALRMLLRRAIWMKTPLLDCVNS